MKNNVSRDEQQPQAKPIFLGLTKETPLTVTLYLR